VRKNRKYRYNRELYGIGLCWKHISEIIGNAREINAVVEIISDI